MQFRMREALRESLRLGMGAGPCRGRGGISGGGGGGLCTRNASKQAIASRWC